MAITKRASCRIHNNLQVPLHLLQLLGLLRLRVKPATRASRCAQDDSHEKYFTAILCHNGQSCLELSPHTSSQCGIPLAFKIAENLMF